MEKILVTLLLVVVSIAALVGILEWSENHKNTAMRTSETIIANVISNNT